MKKILLGLTGSVASTLSLKIVESFLKEYYEIKVVCTEKSLNFFEINEIKLMGVEAYTDKDEWPNKKYVKGDRILHIELRDWCDYIVIAPITANTINKISNGVCDNLLTSIVIASPYKITFLAPAMNDMMWKNEIVKKSIEYLKNDFRFYFIEPQVKVLACGSHGIGAMANIEDIVKKVNIFKDI